MAKTVKVRWNGADADPKSIVQYGVTFEKGKWTDVPVENPEEHPKRLSKLKGNQWFEVKGDEPPPPPVVPVTAPVVAQHVSAPETENHDA